MYNLQNYISLALFVPLIYLINSTFTGYAHQVNSSCQKFCQRTRLEK